MTEQRTILTAKLASLLGFEDGADNVLEHLLSIESKEDLLDYLQQLLGSGKDDLLKSFVEDVGRYRRDESILSTIEQQDERTTTARSSAQPQEAIALTTLNKKTAAPEPKVVVTDSRRNNVTKPNKALPVKEQQRQQQSMKPSPRAATKQTTDVSSAVKPASQEQETDKNMEAMSVPKRGKADFDCGCFGTFHKALTNCLHCGRIACEQEGYGFCPFCGFAIKQVPTGDTTKDVAWQHKERLLRYDRESAQRTIILDDQADYYSSTAWLTEEEQDEAARQEQERQDRVHKRQHLKLSLDL